MARVKTYGFVENETGEQFFVECESVDEAIETACRIAAEIAEVNDCDECDLEYLGVFDYYQAEILGWDTY